MPDPYDHQAPRRGDSPAGEAPAGSAGALFSMLALLVLALALVLWRHLPSPPRPADAPAAEFSAGRAREVLRQLLGDERPHPVGSEADAQVRQRILAALAGLGLQAHVEEGFECRPQGPCARVRNVVARLDGREPGPAVALSAHYDSVEAGPGASDDMTGVAAILEIARALKAGAPPRHPVYLLLDEGEEAGLLGAVAFEDSSPEASQVKAVVNLDTRGTSGPSYMFETSGADGWLIASWAPRAVRPVTTSLAAFIYSLLPNDTDLTVFRQHRVAGLNFAFIGSATRYHTPADSFANSSPASLQHQGENALAAISGLAEADLAAPPPGRLVFFDVASLGIVRWPIAWTLAMAVLALAGILAAVVAGVRRKTMRGADLALGLLAVPAAAVLTALLAYGLELALVSAGPLRVVWLAHPLPAEAAFWFLALTAVAGLALILGRRSGALGLWAGVWLAWAAAGVAAAILAPAVSYIFVAPALVAALAALLCRAWQGRPAGTALAVIVPGIAAALLWFGFVPALYEGLGVTALPIIAVLLAIMLTTLAPLLPGGGPLGRRLWLVSLAATVVAVVVAVPQPRFTPQSPQPLVFAYYLDGDAGTATWLTWSGEPLPAAVQGAVPFGQPGPAFPWSPAYSRARAAAAPVVATLAGTAAPDLQVVESTIVDGKRHLRLRLLSRRGALAATMHIPASARPESILVEGRRVAMDGGRRGAPPAAAASQGWLDLSDLTLPPGGAEIEMVLAATGALDWYVSDSSAGLPPAGAALLAARPPSAVPLQTGDVTLVGRKVRI
jgi:hypothetical protein